MNQPAKPSNVPFFSKLSQRDGSRENKSGQSTSKLDALETLKKTNLTPASGPTLAAAWSEALACEARNSLQVILSGAEILLDDHHENLRAEQKGLLSKMMDNTYHLCNLMASLLGPDEFKINQIEDEIVQISRMRGGKV